MNKGKLLSYLPVIILIVVALNQIFVLQPIYKFSKWKGGGLGVYCRPYEYVLITSLQVGNEEYLIRLKGSPSKVWVNQNEEHLRKYSNRFLNKSYLIDNRYKKGTLSGSAKECSDEEAKFFTAKNTQTTFTSMRYVTSQAVVKVKIYLWERKLLNHKTYRSRLIKTIVNEK